MSEGFDRQRLLWEIFRRLHRQFGPRGWWPARTPFEVVVGAILTQAVAWRNVEQAIANLEAAGLLSPPALWAAPAEELYPLLRPTRYFRAKTAKLKAFLEVLHREYGLELERLFQEETAALRERLLAIPGLGPETADAIVLYAAGQPSFVVDEYTRRIFHRLGETPERISYQRLQDYFTAVLPVDVTFWNEFHALIDGLGHSWCRADPRCDDCPLADLCPTAAAKGGNLLSGRAGN